MEGTAATTITSRPQALDGDVERDDFKKYDSDDERWSVVA